MKTFDSGEAIKFGWKTAKLSWKFFVPPILILWALSAAQYGIKADLRTNIAGIAILFILVGFIQLITNLIITIISLKLVKKEKIEVRDFLPESQLALRYIGASIIYWLIIIGGLILLIVPGIIWGIKFGYYKYLIVDKHQGVIESLKGSAKVTDGAKWSLFGFNLTLGVITLLSLPLLVIGLPVTLPITQPASAFVYRKLAKA